MFSFYIIYFCLSTSWLLSISSFYIPKQNKTKDQQLKKKKANYGICCGFTVVFFFIIILESNLSYIFLKEKLRYISAT